MILNLGTHENKLVENDSCEHICELETAQLTVVFGLSPIVTLKRSTLNSNSLLIYSPNRLQSRWWQQKAVEELRESITCAVQITI